MLLEEGGILAVAQNARVLLFFAAILSRILQHTAFLFTRPYVYAYGRILAIGTSKATDRALDVLRPPEAAVLMDRLDVTSVTVPPPPLGDIRSDRRGEASSSLSGVA